MIPKIALASIAIPLLSALPGCGPNYSPNTYASNAVQQANKVDQGVIIGVRAIAISIDATVTSATAGAVGGIAGSQVGQGAISALGALGGSVAGGLIGNAAAHTTKDPVGYEYIVRKPNGDLLSVTQMDTAPLDIGAHVLVIGGQQARVVADYTVPFSDDPLSAPLSGSSTPVPAVRMPDFTVQPLATPVLPSVDIPSDESDAASPVETARPLA